MQGQSDLMMLYRIARYYYEDGLSQKQIAKRENISRSQISRLLEKARRLGIVQISVKLPLNLDLNQLSEALQESLALKKVVIAPMDEASVNDQSKVSQAIAVVAAEFISSEIISYKNIGIGWGRTVYETSLQLPYTEEKGLHCFIPLIGISGNDNPNLQINAIVDRFSEKFKSQGIYINTPAVRERDIPFSEVEEEGLRKLKRLWKKLDVAIIGLGKPPNKSDNMISELSEDIIKKVFQSKTSGDILSQFFYEDGTAFDYGDSYINIAYEIDNLKDVKNVICLAGGADKVKGIIAAARCGFIKTLVTDSVTARLILEQI